VPQPPLRLRKNEASSPCAGLLSSSHPVAIPHIIALHAVALHDYSSSSCCRARTRLGLAASQVSPRPSLPSYRRAWLRCPPCGSALSRRATAPRALCSAPAPSPTAAPTPPPTCACAFPHLAQQLSTATPPARAVVRHVALQHCLLAPMGPLCSGRPTPAHTANSRAPPHACSRHPLSAAHVPLLHCPRTASVPTRCVLLHLRAHITSLHFCPRRSRAAALPHVPGPRRLLLLRVGATPLTRPRYLRVLPQLPRPACAAPPRRA
jgi:hypothetical protein